MMPVNSQYLPRIYDAVLRKRVASKGAVLVEGESSPEDGDSIG
ncbi:hypothetical protein [Bifidobacterium tibiigranuli]|jgi:hypothetical protein|nr:hypothetical protein [Bifidobacterium tibiigranuli]